MQDIEIITQIRKGATEAPIKFLYKEFPKIKANICRSGGDEGIAKEIFHDSLILLIEKVSDPKFELTAKLSTYLYGINRFLWKNELRKRNRTIELEWSDTLIISEEDLGYSEEKEALLTKMEGIIALLTEKCKKIIELFYLKQESMKSISETLGFSSVNSAKTQKYKCMEKAVQLAEEGLTPNTQTS